MVSFNHHPTVYGIRISIKASFVPTLFSLILQLVKKKNTLKSDMLTSLATLRKLLATSRVTSHPWQVSPAWHS